MNNKWISVKVKYLGHKEILIERKNGDTCYSKSEALQDFFSGEDEEPTKEPSIKEDELLEKARIDYYENKIEMLIRTCAEKENSKLEEIEKWCDENASSVFPRSRDYIVNYEELKSKIKSLKQ